MERIKGWYRSVFQRNESDDAPKTIPVYFVYFFVLNYTIGTGYLGIPFVFYHSGIITAALTLLVITVMCYIGAMWLIETMARAQALETWKTEKEATSFKSGSITGGDKPLLPKFEITLHRKFEFTELCRIFFGVYGEYSIAIILVVNSVLICWACASVAGSSLASNISYNFGSLERCTDSEFHHRAIPGDGCKHSYRFSVVLYSVAVIPLCLLELSEQKFLQLLLGIFRFVIIGCMGIYSIVKLSGDQDFPENYPVDDCNQTVSSCDPNEILDDFDYWHEYSRFGLKGWLTSVPVIFYALLMHASIPKLTHPVEKKQQLKGLMLAVFSTAGVLFLFVGVTVASWFKKDIEETCTLNFVYTAHHGSGALQAFSYFVLLSPVPDVYSAFPLAVMVMRDNLFIVITGHDSITGSVENEKRWNKIRKRVFIVTLTLTSAIVPLVGSLLVANLVDVIRYAGLLGFGVGSFYPAMLQLKSQYDCNKVFYEAVEQSQRDSVEKKSKNGTKEDEGAPLLPEEFPAVKYFHQNNPCYTTPYQTIFSHPYVVVCVSLLSVVAIGLTIASLPIRVHQND